MELPRLPERPKHGHKGAFGRVLVVGGSEGMIGAPALAGWAAFRMGAGLVQVAVPRVILQQVLLVCPELIGLGLGKASAKDELLKAAEAADAVVLGPGLGQTPEALARVQRLVRLAGKPMVLDADALNLLAKEKRWPTYFRARGVITPHPGEMKRLMTLLKTSRMEVPTDDEGRLEVAKLAARTFECTVVLKGERTVITDGERHHFNETGDSSLSKAGTGDVLSGVLAALLAQGMEPMEAAVAAAHVHGRAGEMAGERMGRRAVLARDVIEALAGAVAEHEGGAKFEGRGSKRA